MGISVFTEFPDEEYTVIIDAVFGVGLCREISGHYKDVIDWMNLQDTEKVAVDIPSGICAATGDSWDSISSRPYSVYGMCKIRL